MSFCSYCSSGLCGGSTEPTARVLTWDAFSRYLHVSPRSWLCLTLAYSILNDDASGFDGTNSWARLIWSKGHNFRNFESLPRRLPWSVHVASCLDRCVGWSIVAETRKSGRSRRFVSFAPAEVREYRPSSSQATPRSVKTVKESRKKPTGSAID